MKRTLPLCGLVLALVGGSLHAQSTVPTVATTPAALNLPVGGTANSLDLTTVFSVPGVTGQIAQFNTSFGLFNVELLAAAAPNHVTNFIAYTNAGSYSNTFFHRVAYFEASPAGPSILQGGGYSIASGLPAVTKRPSVNLEYSLPNARGTLAAARTTDPNSATSEWFFNTRDNSTILGPLNDGFGYSVFARVIGTGMFVVDTIAGLPLYNIGGAFTSLPLRDIAAGQTQVFFANLVPLNTVTPIPLFPSANGQAAVVSFTVSSSLPAVASATLLNGRTLSIAPLALGSTTLTLTATDTNGNTAQTTLSVTVASAFTTSLANAGVPANKRAATDDPDADGIVNLLEYALGLSPTTPSTTGLPAAQVAAGNLTFTYKRAVATGLTYVVQTTTDLTTPASWTTTGVTQGTPDVNGNTTATIPYSTGPRFLRLSVALNP